MKGSRVNNEKVVKALSQDLTQGLFPSDRQLIPNLNDIYELELAFYENLILSDAELIRNAAYFSRLGRRIHPSFSDVYR